MNDVGPAENVVAASYIVATEHCQPDLVATVGGKAVGLGSLLRAGQRVPASFVVGAHAYLDYVAHGAGSGDLPASLRQPIVAAYEALCRQRGAQVVVAVR